MLLRFACVLLTLASAARAGGDWFQIRIVDRQTGRGVPLVALIANNDIVSFTDSNGIVAWNEPGLMDREVYFRIESPGYRFPGGVASVAVTRGGSVELRMERLAIAERLYRVTGQGIYRDILLTGFPVPIHQPALNGEVLGQDTVRVTPYRGKLFWLWGDTNRASAPLGNFSTTSATSELPGHGGLDPGAGVDLTYFTGADGFAKAMCPWPLEGLKWMDALMTVRDPAGEERLLARYFNIGEHSKATESGLAVFNDETREFDRLVVYPHPNPEVGPGGVPPLGVRSGGAEYFYFCDERPGPVVRVRAEWKSVVDLGAYEVFDGGQWKAGAALPPPVKTWLDMESGKPVDAAGKVSWNEYRKRWIAIAQVNPGEVWYAEGDTPTGPWVYTTRVAVNGNYYFYWPVQHPFFDQNGGRTVYFEGTYTDTFSGNPVITPRYNYNQLMYRLSLDDERLFLPAPVYRMKDGRMLMRDAVDAGHAWNDIAEIAFFALPKDRRRQGTIEVGGLFAALPMAAAAPPAGIAGTWNCDGFSIDIAVQGGRVTAQTLGMSGSGSLREGKASFVLRQGDGAYPVEAALQAGKLNVRWTDPQHGAGQSTCERAAVSTEQWTASSALVPLYFYDGRYTTQPRVGAAPLARVWRSPVDARVLDRDASPMAPR